MMDALFPSLRQHDLDQVKSLFTIFSLFPQFSKKTQSRRLP